jgi:hypothetical protein
MKPLPRPISLVPGVLVAVLALPGIAGANHAWSCYHWARTNNPLQLDVGDNVTNNWDAYLDTSIQDWDVSSVLELNEVAGGANRRNCKPTSGRIEVCNSSYGNNGWLGIAQIWVNGCHITQATTKVNDTYFNQAQYNTAPWHRTVMCQEVGHNFGLDHQDENFNNANLGSCMDYTNDPDGGPGGNFPNDPSNEHPNQHDYDELEDIYAHTDLTDRLDVFGDEAIDLNSPAEWGRLVRTLAGGRVQVFERELADGRKLLTRVIWAESGQPRK